MNHPSSSSTSLLTDQLRFLVGEHGFEETCRALYDIDPNIAAKKRRDLFINCYTEESDCDVLSWIHPTSQGAITIGLSESYVENGPRPTNQYDLKDIAGQLREHYNRKPCAVFTLKLWKPKHDLAKFLQDDCIKLFDTIEVHGDVNHRRLDPYAFEALIDVYQNRRVVPNLAFKNCSFSPFETHKLKTLLLTNSLRGLSFEKIRFLDPAVSSSHFAEGLSFTHELRDLSIRLPLQTDDTSEGGRETLFQYDTLGKTLVRSITDYLTVSNRAKKLTSLRLTWRYDASDTDQVEDLRPLLDSLKGHPTLRSIFIAIDSPFTSNPQTLFVPLVEFVKSVTTSIPNITFSFYPSPNLCGVENMASLLSNDENYSCRVRHFRMDSGTVRNRVYCAIGWENCKSRAMAETLLKLLTRQMPYLFDLGVSWEDTPDWERDGKCWEKLKLQVERNQVGRALYHSSVVSTIPLGLWPLVLAKAAKSVSIVTQKRPYDGIYDMLTNVAQIGILDKAPSGTKRKISILFP